MKLNTHNRWLKIIVWLQVMVIFVMLAIPAELTNEQLTQIKPGMTLDEAQRVLGAPCKTGNHFVMYPTRKIGPNDIIGWHLEGKFWRPNIRVTILSDSRPTLADASCKWVGRSYLLWVVHEDGIVKKTWLFPITRSGGGLQGCIDTIKEYWNKWWGK